MNKNDTTTITLRNISQQSLKTIDAEAKKNKISRNSLMQIIIDNFADNVAQNTATQLLSGPLEDVVNQLNLLTKTTNKNTESVGADLSNVAQELTELGFNMSKLVSINKQILEKVSVNEFGGLG